MKYEIYFYMQKNKNTKQYNGKCHDLIIDGEKYGYIELEHDNYRNTDYYSVYFDRNITDLHLYDRYKTLFAAKQAILQTCTEKGITKKATTNVPAIELPYYSNSEFYPTPDKLAGKMFANIRKWGDIRTILEPSAGKGDILDCLKSVIKKRWHYNSREIDIDCIEIDENLKFILQGKGYRVVHNDFLTYQSHKYYDLIIMNPPFSNGDEHLLKAIEMQERNGGQIICLLNAETLRNAYSNRRKVLIQKLGYHKANITYVSKAFDNAERKASVDVAIISIDIPRPERNSEFFDRMEKAHEQFAKEHEQSKEIAPSDKIESLIRAYQIEVAATMQFLNEYNSFAKKILTGSKEYAHAIITLQIGGHNTHLDNEISTEDINNYLHIVRGKYWRKLLSMPEFINQMTSTIYHNYESRIQDMCNYEFSQYNIEWLFFDLRDQLYTSVDDEIMRLFEKFSEQHTWYPECAQNIHYFNGWKTNKAHKVNYKVIIPANGCFATGYKSMNSRYKNVIEDQIKSYRCYEIICDLEKTLNYLDGKRTEDVNLSVIMDRAERTHTTKNIYCKYFDVSFYKKGTCHIKFRPETYRLVDALNIYAAKNRAWLPPCYGEKHYRDMSNEEKQVIDDFQGEAAYEAVMSDKAAYALQGVSSMLLLNQGII